MTTSTTQSIETIANSLVEKCRQYQFEQAVKELYSSDIVSVESMETPNSPKEIHGMQAVLEKGQRWTENTEIHSMEIEGPLVGGSEFAVAFTLDATCKLTNERHMMKEIAVYQVRDGKIVREEFFYNAACN